MYFFLLLQPLPFKPQVQSPMCYQPKHSQLGFCSDQFHPQADTNHSSAGQLPVSRPVCMRPEPGGVYH